MDHSDVTQHGRTRRDVDLQVEHPEDLFDLRILNDHVGTMTPSAPKREQEPHVHGGVRDPMSVHGQQLSFRGLIWITAVGMPAKIAG